MANPKEEIEDSHGELSALVKTYLPDALTISVVTLSRRMSGQMILHHPDYDKRIVASRLRMCADILDGTASEQSAREEGK